MKLDPKKYELIDELLEALMALYVAFLLKGLSQATIDKVLHDLSLGVDYAKH